MKTKVQSRMWVMLPTKGYAPHSPDYIDYISLTSSKMKSLDGKLEILRGMDRVRLTNPQHLYLTSDKEIQKGDLKISCDIHGKVLGIQVHESMLGKYDKKIIATTDKSLNCKQPESCNKSLSTKCICPKFISIIPENMVKYWVETQGNVEEVEIEDIDSPLNYPEVIFFKTTKDNELIVYIPEFWERVKLDPTKSIDLSKTKPEDVTKYLEMGSVEEMQERLGGKMYTEEELDEAVNIAIKMAVEEKEAELKNRYTEDQMKAAFEAGDKFRLYLDKLTIGLGNDLSITADEVLKTMNFNKWIEKL